jgi:pyruvate,water dikinase
MVCDGKEIVLTGNDAEQFEELYLKSDQRITEFKGRIACKGKVEGVARIVLGPADFNKLQEGEILVTTNTSPDFVPILKKAKAIIAEDGGITAHVSVVSREFGIPCIVGIYHISRIIKDGDPVEVDAEKGIVRIM